MIKIGSGNYLELKKKAKEFDKREARVKPHDVYQLTFGDNTFGALCGNCRGHVFNDNIYCPKCGHRINWGL